MDFGLGVYGSAKFRTPQLGSIVSELLDYKTRLHGVAESTLWFTDDDAVPAPISPRQFG
jgi:hypothetical protein